MALSYAASAILSHHTCASEPGDVQQQLDDDVALSFPRRLRLVAHLLLRPPGVEAQPRHPPYTCSALREQRGSHGCCHWCCGGLAAVFKKVHAPRRFRNSISLATNARWRTTAGRRQHHLQGDVRQWRPAGTTCLSLLALVLYPRICTRRALQMLSTSDALPTPLVLLRPSPHPR